jgi:hypothetical protein
MLRNGESSKEANKFNGLRMRRPIAPRFSAGSGVAQHRPCDALWTM